MSTLIQDHCSVASCFGAYNSFVSNEVNTHNTPCVVFKQVCCRHSNHHRYICTSHGSILKHINSAKQHVRRMRRRLEEETHLHSSPSDADDYACHPITDWSYIQEFINSNVHDPNTRQYLLDEHRGPTVGARMLVKRAFDSPDGTMPSPDETLFHLLMASFLLSLTENQRQTFFVLIEVIYNNSVIQCRKAFGPKDNNSPPNDGIFCTGTTRMPTCKDDFNRIYLTKTNSIIRRLPHPPVHRSIHETHAYTDYHQTIQNYFSMGKTPFDVVSYCRQHDVVPFRYSQIMEKVEQYQPTYVILIDEWRDKFDGNTSKQNRTSVLANTSTIVGQHKSYSTSVTDTYPQCIGSGSDPSTLAELELANQINDITDGIQWFYSPKDSAVVPCLVFVRSSIQDRVERSAFTYHLTHTSPICRRWGYTGAFDLRGLASCLNCFQRRLDRMCFPEDACQTVECLDCADFDFERVPNKYFVTLPKAYPLKRCHCGSCPTFPQGRDIPNGLSFVVPQKMDFDWVRQVVRCTIHHRRAGVWNVTEGKSYVYLSGLNKKMSELIETTLQQHQDLAENEIVDALLPAAYVRNIPLDHYTDAGMHLLKGLAENVLELVSDWLKKLKLNRSFCKHCSELNRSLNLLHLSWLRVLPFGGKDEETTGGWVSENHLDFIRVLPFLLSTFLSESPRDLFSEENSKPTAHLVVRFAYLTNCLYSRCMYSTIQWSKDSKAVEAQLLDYAKLFLSDMISLDLTGKWMEKGNPVSLLNLPFNFRMFGGLRDVWDGNRERYASHLKHFLFNVRSKSTTYYKLKMEQILQEQTLRTMMEAVQPLVLNPLLADRHEPSKRYSDFKIYPSADAVSSLSGVPISAIQLSMGQTNAVIDGIDLDRDTHDHIVVIFRGASSGGAGDSRMCSIVIVEVDIDNPFSFGVDQSIELFGIQLHFRNAHQEFPLSSIRRKMKRSVLLLPRSDKYTFLGSDWTVLSFGGNFVCPSIIRDNYLPDGDNLVEPPLLPELIPVRKRTRKRKKKKAEEQGDEEDQWNEDEDEENNGEDDDPHDQDHALPRDHTFNLSRFIYENRLLSGFGYLEDNFI